MKKIVTSPDIYPESIETFNLLGYDIIFSFENTHVSKPLRYHTDMQLLKLDSDKYICAPECYEYYNKILSEFNIKLIKGNTYLSCNYPDDIAYNIIVGDNIAIHNFKYSDKILKENLTCKKLINVSQGYTACTLCMLTDSSYITSDKGIYKTLSRNKLDVLSIYDKNILLPGYNHGFFGGASVLLDDGILAVNGKIEAHPNYMQIKSFCLNYNINILSLCDKPMMDIGGFVKI